MTERSLKEDEADEEEQEPHMGSPEFTPHTCGQGKTYRTDKFRFPTPDTHSRGNDPRCMRSIHQLVNEPSSFTTNLIVSLTI